VTVQTVAAWGKAVDGQVHPLICHAYDTAAVAERVLRQFIGPTARDELLASFHPLGNPTSWIALLCGLHDLGKATPSFQAIRADLASTRLAEPEANDVGRLGRHKVGTRRLDTPHGLVTAMHVQDMLVRWGASIDTAERIAVAIGGHHGHLPDGSLVRQARREVNNHGRQRWEDTREDLVAELIRLRGLPEPTALPWGEVHVSDVAALCLAALTTISDWIASDITNFPLTDPDDLDAYATSSEHRADAAVARLDLRPWLPDPGFRTLFPGDTPRPVQAEVERLVRDRTEPTLLLIEAPTGEGKSKAGLQAAATLVRQLGLIGTYVAMPTQATSNQMLGEVQELAGQASVKLIHTNAREYVRDNSTTPTGIGVDDPDDLDVTAQEWFTRKRSLLASLGVGTVDQILKAVIRSNHVFVPLVALTNKVVVIDEIHGYDTYMSTLLDRLLTWLGRLGVSVIMLSATLPSSRRRDLVAAWQAGALRCLPREVQRPAESMVTYPAVTIAGKGRPTTVPVGVSELNGNRALHLEHVPDSDIVDWVLDRAGVGSVAVMHNLVQRAVSTYTALEARISAMPDAERPHLVMINGRMPTAERARVEAWLVESFGQGGTRPRAIVVGTQVLEQGLDLDFDTVLTDLAPVDWMIQRAGRLHRHRPGTLGGTPTLGVTGVSDHGDAPPTFPRYVNLVYAPAILLRTWALLRGRTTLSLPGEVPALVDAVYGPEEAVACPSGWEDAWFSAADSLRRARERSERNARIMYLPLPNAIGHVSEVTKHSKSSRHTREQGRTR